MTTLTHAIAFPALSALCLLVAGCTHDSEGASLEQSVAAPPAPRSRMMALASAGEMRQDRQRPIAYLPASAGRIESVRVRPYADGLRQDVMLGGGAVKTIHDSITVLARADRRGTLDDRVPLDKPTEAAIRSEIGGQFPRVAMQVAQRESGNAYGPYGLALGRVGETRCLYMWQWIDANRVPPDAGVSGPISVRVRLCRVNTTFDEMAALVDHMMIGGESIEPVAADAVVTAPAGDVASTPRRRRPRKARVAARHRAETASRDRDPGEAIMPSDPPRPAGAAPTQAYAPAAEPSQTASVAKLSSDLPAAAYMGPRAAKSY